MGRAGETTISAAAQQGGETAIPQRRRVVVDVILLLTDSDRILLRERANTGYGDGAYEPPSGQLADRETIVETAIRVALDEAGILIGTENVSLAHVMHDVSGGGRIAFFLAVSGWEGESTSPDVRWFPLGNLPTNMLDRVRVALRNCADEMRFSTYPSFAPTASSRVNGFTVANGSVPPTAAAHSPPWLEACGARLVG
jgi:8-oxo-dGTP diphosphatase